MIHCHSQDVFTGGVYLQNFGTTTLSSGAFVDNSTFLGWYAQTAGVFLGTQTITAGAPSNAGGIYMYICTSGNDVKIGTRPSNGSGGGPCDGTPTTCGHGWGVRLTNNLGATIQSLKVNFDAYQFSLAQNGSANNPLLFYYRVGAAGTQTSVASTVTAGTNVAGLTFNAPQSTSVSGGSQVQGFPCTQTAFQTACFAVNIPAGNEIMLAWWDPNNSNNDPHMAIDNLAVSAYSDNACVDLLPMELISFDVKEQNGSAVLQWVTASEMNNHHFSIERSLNADDFEVIGEVKAAGNSTSYKKYEFVDEQAIYNSYYRLKQTDNNGNYSYSNIIHFDKQKQGNDRISIMPNPSSSGEFIVKTETSHIPGSNYRVFDFTGKMIRNELLEDNTSIIHLNENEKGVYLIMIQVNGKFYSSKLVYD